MLFNVLTWIPVAYFFPLFSVIYSVPVNFPSFTFFSHDVSVPDSDKRENDMREKVVFSIGSTDIHTKYYNSKYFCQSIMWLSKLNLYTYATL